MFFALLPGTKRCHTWRHFPIKKKNHKQTEIRDYSQPGTQVWASAAQVRTTDTCDSWDWYTAALPGDVFMEDVASGLLRSAKGRMVRQDCRY